MAMFDNASDVQRLDTQHLVFVNEVTGRFMDGIAAANPRSITGWVLHQVADLEAGC